MNKSNRESSAATQGCPYNHRLLLKRIPLYLTFLALIFTTSCTPKTTGNTVIRFLEAPDRGGAWSALIEQFEAEHPDIDVELVEGPVATNIREDLYTISFLAQEPTYDLVYLDVIWVAKFAEAGWLLPLDDRFLKKEQAKFLPGDIEGSRYRGQIFRVPMQSDGGVLYYRRDLLAEKGFSPPRTWEELVKIASALQDPPRLWGFVFQGKQYEGLVCNFLEVLWGAGGSVLDEAGEVQLDDLPAQEALAWYRSLIVKGIAPPGVTTYEEEEARHLFQEGHAVFMRNWPYAWELAQSPDSPVRGKVGLIPMVHAEGGESAATLGGWGFGIAQNTQHPEAAWKFIQFATSEAGQKLFHLKNGVVPSRQALFKDSEILSHSPYYEDLKDILLSARPRPVHPRYGEISDVISLHVSRALIGREAPEVALNEAAREIRQILEK